VTAGTYILGIMYDMSDMNLKIFLRSVYARIKIKNMLTENTDSKRKIIIGIDNTPLYNLFLLKTVDLNDVH